MEEMYAADRYTIDQVGVRDETLMECAGQAVISALLPWLRTTDAITVLAGVGNNGGDGFVIARRLKNLGFKAQLWLIPPLKKVRGAALCALNCFQASGYHHHQYHAKLYSRIAQSDVIIDALLGIGMNGELRSPYDEVIRAVNESDAIVYSVDIPSGVSADGADVSLAVQADVTFTIQHPKLSAFLYPAASCYGKLEVVDIGIPPQASGCLTNQRLLWTEQDYLAALPQRSADAHKGSNGRGLIAGGCPTMLGAPLISAAACLNSGIGLLSLAIPKASRPAAAGRILEATYLDCEEEDGYLTHLEVPSQTSVVAVGMGLSRDPRCAGILLDILSKNIPTVIDADGLFHLQGQFELLHRRTAVTVLTPHMGEMARLCGCSVDRVRRERFSISREFAVEHGVYLVLKGPYTIVTTPEGDQYVNTSGNAGLAKGGSGDALTGIIAAYLPNYSDPGKAIINAVYAHGKAADNLVRQGMRPESLTASDLVSALSFLAQRPDREQENSR